MENNVEVAVQATENASTEQRPAARQENSERPQRQSYNRQQRRRKVCTFCTERDAVIDYKNPAQLRKFISERGKILPRRMTGTCARHQRELTVAIKRARQVALLPYISD
ncbi:MAG: 30S ribosomal protein S18 [Oscillospiraceae bacterium]|nr:30S ribosomal protein S18 [Oscillospiraceae bacterium]MBR5045303.1 30S ribosomal protein S18 [Oscillospiraceae bacterium]MBR5070717.1 30S ribosomal protein S18 [Oscillospiraceae bacterium]